MSETLEQLEARHAAELRAFNFIQADADTSEAAAKAHVASSCEKLTIAGFTIGTETIDSQYVTINLPDPLPANWSLIKMAMKPDINLTMIEAGNTGRVHKDKAVAVLDFIQEYLP
jgi:hypothetical protein